MLIVQRLAFGALLTLAATTGARAEWRYCLAASDEAKKVYLSDPFQTNTPPSSLEASFGEVLKQSEIAHGAVQCPRGASKRQIVDMRKETIGFNKDFFSRTPVELHWTPNSSQEVPSGGEDADE
jgi:hypothetical protein